MVSAAFGRSGLLLFLSAREFVFVAWLLTLTKRTIWPRGTDNSVRRACGIAARLSHGRSRHCHPNGGADDLEDFMTVASTLC